MAKRGGYEKDDTRNKFSMISEKDNKMKTQKEKRAWLKGCLLVISLLIVPMQAGAHNLWLGLDHYDQKVGDTAKVFLYLAHSLPFADLGRPEKMKDFFLVERQSNS
jgi:hypothetical protein